MKNLRITVNGNIYDVQVEEVSGEGSFAPAPAPVPVQTAKAPAPSAAGETVDAPMPGTVLDVKVKAGDSVKKGDCIVVVEAMKMETEIFAPKDCTVASVFVKKGDSVESGQKLVEIK